MDEDKDAQNPEEGAEETEPEATEEETAAEEEASADDSSGEAEPEATEEEAAAEEEASKGKAPSDSSKDGTEEPSSNKKKEATAEEPDEEKKPEKKEETAEDLLKSELAEVKIRRAKGSKNITHGIVHVTASFNNTKVNITDMKGNTISWSSSGKCNFRGSRKSTAYAAQIVTQDAGRTAMSHGLKEVIVKVRGPGMGRDSAVRALQALGFTITAIVDVTPVPHNGCRPPKRRRV